MNPRGNSYNAVVYSITLTAGQNYQFLLKYTGPAVTWYQDDCYLYILNSSGQKIAEDDDSGDGIQFNSVDTTYGAALIGAPTASTTGDYYGYSGPWKAPYTGNYYVVCTTFGPNTTMTTANLTIGSPGPIPDPQAPPPAPTPSGTGVPNVKLAPAAGTPSLLACTTPYCANLLANLQREPVVLDCPRSRTAEWLASPSRHRA